VINRKLKIAMIEPVGGHGGMDYYDFGLCGGLVQAQVMVTLYTCDETPGLAGAGFVTHRWYRGIYGKQPVLLRALRFLFASLHVFGDVLSQRIPLVHFHFFGVGILQLILIVFAKLLRRKVVVTVHDVEGFIEGKGSSCLANITYRFADRLIVHNQFSRAELISNLQVSAYRVVVIPHGNYRHVCPKIIDRIAARKQLGWSQHEKILLFFGQIKGVKRLDLLLSALAIVLKAQPHIRLVIAGKVADVPFAEYQMQIDMLGISNNCTCLVRYIKNEDVPIFFAACDLVVLPYDRIYQSGVLLMSMSFARAVVVSDIPGMLEIVRDRESGYVFQNGNSIDLAAVLLSAVLDDTKREQIAQNGLRLMVNDYAWSVIGEMTADLYSEVLTGEIY